MIHNEKGITMMVLVVMIIILITLAGVTISEISSSGVIKEVTEDVQYQYNASVNEALKMNATLTNQLEDWGL